MNSIATSDRALKAPPRPRQGVAASRWTAELEWQGLGRLLIRPLTPDDLELERRFVASLSDETWRRRAMGAPAPGEQDLARLVRFDSTCELALAAIRRDAHGDELIAVARFSRAHQPGDAKFAIVVADLYQRHCLGTELMCRLMDAAALMGYRRLVGVTPTPNLPMLGLARRMGCRVFPDPVDDTRQCLSVPLHAKLLPSDKRCVSRRANRLPAETT